jgi:hypothetical protein
MEITVKTDDGRELQIAKGSHFFLKDASSEETYLEWQEIQSIQPLLNEALANGEELLNRVAEIIEAQPYLFVKE